MLRILRFRHSQWRRLCRSLLLPLLLAIVQQGGLLHELSHYAADAAAARSSKSTSHGEVCQLCLAFAQVGSGATPHAEPPPLLADLSFRWAPAGATALGALELPAERSRGPPSVL